MLVRPLYLPYRWLVVIALGLTTCVVSYGAAQSAGGGAVQATPEAAAIISVMQKSADDWNRGDIDAFATSYKDSPEILFIGHSISHGYAQMVATYKKSYSTREQMGTLNFSQLEVQPLDPHFATVTGHFHLERTTAGGGNADGYFLLVLEKTSSGWKIVRDDTTALPTVQQK
jgi:ketosteroid isomerase-like protein